jgi:MFS family permease
VLVILFAIAGVARGLLRVTSAAMIAELRNEGRDVGVASGVYNAGLDIGAIIGPIAGGTLATAFGIGAMFQIIAVGSLAAYFAVAVSTPQGRATLRLGRTRPAKAA